MRVDRALDKLHSLLARRGIKSTATALGAVLAGQVATAAPASLAASVTSVALAGAASGTGAVVIFMGMTKLQISVAAALVVAGGSTLWSEHQTRSNLRAENAALVDQTAEISHLKIENTQLDADAQKAEALRREAGALAALRVEAAQLKKSIERGEAARKAQADARAAKFSRTADGQSLYAMKDLDEKPKAVYRAQPKYPAELKVLGMEGEALMCFVVGADGAVREVEIENATNEAFGVAAKKALEQWKFKPGQKDGVTVNTRIAQPFVFSIATDDNTDWF
jgi:TonB family protein